MTEQAPDLFGYAASKQGDLFANQPGRPDNGVAVVKFARYRLNVMLAEMRAKQSEGTPWKSMETTVNKILFPQMIRNLPESEGADLLSQFQSELQRLNMAE